MSEQETSSRTRATAHEGRDAKPRIFPAYLLWFAAAGLAIGVAGTLMFPPLRADTSTDMSPEAVTKRLAPVAHVEFAAPAPTHTLKTGEQVYSGLCVACHGSGVAGAPKVGNKAAWQPRIAQGFDTLVKHATEGFKGMPAKGGNAELDAQEVARAVAYMADQAGADFKAP